MKKFITIIICFLVVAKLSAQQEAAIFSHYYLTPIIINPAVAGFAEEHQVQVNARGSWTGFIDAPSTVHASYNGPVGNNFGFGLGVMTESAAQLNMLTGKMNFAFRFPIKEDIKISAGVSASYQQMSIDNNITASNFFQEGDKILERALDGEGTFDASFGLYGTFRDQTFAGLVLADLVQGKLDGIKTTSSQANFLSYFMFHFGHRFYIEDLKFSLTPSILLRQIQDVPNQVDLNIQAGFLDDQLIAGLSYHSLGAVGVMLGTKLSNFYLYYSYELSFQRFQQFNSGSHEITLAFAFKRKDVPGKTKAPNPSTPAPQNNKN